MGIAGLKVDEINSKVARYWSVSVTEETASTQSDLVKNFKVGNVLVAEYQSAGRGRLDRKFLVPPRKGLTFSFCISTEKDLEWIPLITGLAATRAINKYLKSDLVRIKWPNDLIIDDKKLAGILSEKCEAGVVVGIGINIYQTQDELPIADAISLSMIGQVNRDDLLIEILNELGSALSDIENQKTLYRENCATIGNRVRATLPDGQVIEDLALGISDDGSLLLNSREIRVGDIVHLRYASE
ncbi:MAG: biotin--[acetyl-CoA-carboxylase] ligase [Candidatus Nanopelagicaceae bacterium]